MRSTDGEDDVEVCVALGFGIVCDGFGDGSGLDVKFQRLLREIRQAGNFGLAVAVGADLEIVFAHVHEAVAKLDRNFCVVDGLFVAVEDGEAGAAGADAAVDLVWSGLGSLILRCGRILG